jgi:Superinfection immunity protein
LILDQEHSSCDGTHACWLIPEIRAGLRGNFQLTLDVILSAFLGWSCIGWIIALIWACKNDRIVYVQSPQRY